MWGNMSGPASTIVEHPLRKNVFVKGPSLETRLKPGFSWAEFISIIPDLGSSKKWTYLATSNWKRKKIAVAAKNLPHYEREHSPIKLAL